MRKDHIRDKKTAPKKFSLPVWPIIVLLVGGLFFVRNTLKEFFPGMSSADVANEELRQDMEIRHPITKLYFETYKFDGASEFADDFWKNCEDNLNDPNKASLCANLVKNLIDREGSTPKIAKSITNHYCLERSFSPFCNKVYAYWKEESQYALRLLERSCKELKDKKGCELSRQFVE